MSLSRFCLTSSFTVRSWWPSARRPRSVEAAGGAAGDGTVVEGGGWRGDCTVRHYVVLSAGAVRNWLRVRRAEGMASGAGVAAEHSRVAILPAARQARRAILARAGAPAQ